jgi:SAM-dependent methyltransferase
VNDARGWDSAYRGAPPPWDIGAPQPPVLRIAECGGFRGDVIDAGCGTGENTLALAVRGLSVLGVDWAPLAIDRARDKAAERGVDAEFVVGDALVLEALGRSFDSALDCGLFHTFDDVARGRYVESLARVVRPGGVLHILCFSEREPWDGGPRRVTQDELHEAFAEGWRVLAIEADRFATLRHVEGAHAWHATIERSVAAGG